MFVKALRLFKILFINISAASISTTGIHQIGSGVEIQVSMPRPLPSSFTRSKLPGSTSAMTGARLLCLLFSHVTDLQGDFTWQIQRNIT
jgi:hypothetical protein